MSKPERIIAQHMTKSWNLVVETDADVRLYAREDVQDAASRSGWWDEDGKWHGPGNPVNVSNTLLLLGYRPIRIRRK